jgi:Tfp pilus assembly protein PilF
LFALFGTLGLVLLYRDIFVGGLHFAGDYPTGSFFNNLGTALRHLWQFIEQTLLPSEPVISDAWAISHGWDAGEVAAVLGTVLLLGGTGLGFALGNPAAFGIAWFLLWIIPGVGFFPTDHYHSDQYLYLASWGLIFAVVYGISRAWRPIGRQLVPGSEVLVFGPVLIVLFLITAFSNARWWDHQRLFESEIASDPHYIEGRIQLAAYDLGENRPLDALNHVLQAIESHKKKRFTGYWDTANTYRILGEIQLKLGMSHDAVNSLDIALEARPRSARSWHLLGLAHLDNENYAEAEQSLRRSLEIRPGDSGVEADLGVALLGQEKTVDGRAILVPALRQPGTGNFRRHSALGISLVEEQQFEAARPHLEQALDAREIAKTRAALAYVLWQLGEQDQAYESLSMAMQNEAQGEDDYINWVNEQINNQPVLLPGS